MDERQYSWPHSFLVTLQQHCCQSRTHRGTCWRPPYLRRLEQRELSRGVTFELCQNKMAKKGWAGEWRSEETADIEAWLWDKVWSLTTASIGFVCGWRIELWQELYAEHISLPRWPSWDKSIHAKRCILSWFGVHNPSQLFILRNHMIEASS